jgi:hypothetical protein
LFLHTLVTVMVGTTLAPEERAALDRAIVACYRGAGITTDPATWTQPAPLLSDLARALSDDPDAAAGTLAARLAPWVHGSFADLFAGPTTTAPGGHLVVWSLRHLSDELRTVGTLLALDAIWRDIDRPPPSLARPTVPTSNGGSSPVRRPQDRPAAADPNGGRGVICPPRAPRGVRRLGVVDEAWLLMRDGQGARFLFRMAKAARKRNAGLTVVTQDAADVLGSELGIAVVANAATQVLMRQSTQSIDAVAEAFGLTAGEARLLLSAERGQALLVAGSSRVGFRVVASAEEDRLCQSLLGFDIPDGTAAAEVDKLFESEAG